MFILDQLLHYHGEHFTAALNRATAGDLLAALRRTDLVHRSRERILDALWAKYQIEPAAEQAVIDGLACSLAETVAVAAGAGLLA